MKTSMLFSSIALLALTTGNAACGDDDDDGHGDHDDHAGRGGSGGSDGGTRDSGVTEDASTAPNALFAVSSIVFGEDTSTTYVNLIEALDGQSVDFDDAREFSGLADVWVHDGAVFVADGETLTITKFSIEGDRLVEGARIGFGAYGLTDFGFWLNTFISPEKAYFLNPPVEYVVWNPSTMEITGTVKLPELEDRGALVPYGAYTDRSVAVRGNRLYQPIYWADDMKVEFAPDSLIAVFDTEQDTLVSELEAPCPGLDFATIDDAGDIYFSTWVFAPGGAALLEQPATCVVKLEQGDSAKPTLAFNVKDVTGGREGGALRYLGGDRALLSVLHPEHAAPGTEDADIASGANWHFWSYDFSDGSAEEIESIDWNSGAAYSAEAGGKKLILVPDENYTATTVYDLSEEANPRPVLDTEGWSLRLFGLR